jgi:(heptosyl)LPS beta-1,4-glucosyltransferase
MADPLPLSGVVITFNEADRIERCLRSMLAVCRDVTVVDSQSTDGTPELARRLGARVVDQPWLGFGRQKNLAIEQATQPWVLLLDADEWLAYSLGLRRDDHDWSIQAMATSAPSVA